MYLKLLVLIFIGCCFVYAQSDKLVDILTKIKTEEQLHFVQFHVTRGYFRSNKIPTKKYERGYSEDFSKQLFETFLYLSESEKQKSTKSGLETAKNNLLITICTPEGICFDPDDSGIHPQ